MLSCYQTGYLIRQFYLKRVNAFERRLLNKLMDGISGLGDISDNDIKDYLSKKQITWIKELGKRFRITEKTKL